MALKFWNIPNVLFTYFFYPVHILSNIPNSIIYEMHKYCFLKIVYETCYNIWFWKAYCPELINPWLHKNVNFCFARGIKKSMSQPHPHGISSISRHFSRPLHKCTRKIIELPTAYANDAGTFSTRRNHMKVFPGVFPGISTNKKSSLKYSLNGWSSGFRSLRERVIVFTFAHLNNILSFIWIPWIPHRHK